MKTFMLALFFTVNKHATNALTVASDTKSFLSREFSFKAAHTRNDHDFRVSLMLSQNPDATKDACEKCVSAYEDHIANMTALQIAETELAAAQENCENAREYYDECKGMEDELASAERKAHDAVNAKLRGLKGKLQRIEEDYGLVNGYVMQDDAVEALKTAKPDEQWAYDGSGLVKKVEDWMAAYNAWLSKQPECAGLKSNETEVCSVVAEKNATVNEWLEHTKGANETLTEACEAMRNAGWRGVLSPPPPASVISLASTMVEAPP